MKFLAFFIFLIGVDLQRQENRVRIFKPKNHFWVNDEEGYFCMQFSESLFAPRINHFSVYMRRKGLLHMWRRVHYTEKIIKIDRDNIKSKLEEKCWNHFNGWNNVYALPRVYLVQFRVPSYWGPVAFVNKVFYEQNSKFPVILKFKRKWYDPLAALRLFTRFATVTYSENEFNVQDYACEERNSNNYCAESLVVWNSRDGESEDPVHERRVVSVPIEEEMMEINFK